MVDVPKKAKHPAPYANEQDYLQAMRKEFSLDLEFDRKNREAGIDDSKFMVGDQWPDKIKKKRDRAGKPVLTSNKLVAYVALVLGNRRLNETQIKVLPDHGGTKAVATVREGLIRNIQKNSGDFAYTKAHENQVICGVGNFQIKLEYAADDVFEQNINIQPITNPWATVWDRTSVEPTGRDAQRVFVIDTIPEDDFKAKYKDQIPSDLTTDTNLLGEMQSTGWLENGNYRVVSHWCMRTRKRTLALMNTGAVEDITDIPIEQVQGRIVVRKDGSPIMREADRSYAELRVCSGHAILDGPYELPIDRVPVFRVPGWEVNVGEDRHRWGLIRFAKDPMRLHNYWRSTIAEKLMASPRMPWIAAASAVKGRENEWRNSHRSDDNLLIWDDENTQHKPERAPPVQIEPALIQEAGTAANDIKDILNLHEASLGQESNEVSGKAIVARQRVGELGTVIYQDNLNLAIGECGRVADQLIPLAYDTPRIVKIIGTDGKEALQVINDAANPDSVDITLGKYAVTTTTGPSFVTKRLEAAEAMLNMVNAMPQTMAVAADKIVEAQDWPESEEISRRLKMTLPPGILSDDDMTEDQKQAMAAMQEKQVQQEQLALRGQMAEIAEKEAKAQEATARADLARAQADKARAEADAVIPQAAAKVEKTLAEAEAIPVKTEAEVKSMRMKDTLAAIETAEPKESRSDSRRAKESV